MINGIIDIGDICRVVPHDKDWDKVGAVSLAGEYNVIWIPRGAFVLVTNAFENSTGSASWFHAIYNGQHVEISSDLLEPSREF